MANGNLCDWYYTVYLAANDEIICFGNAEEVCRKMNIKRDSFHSVVAKVDKGKIKKYVIVVEDIAKGKITVRGEPNVDYQTAIAQEKEELEDKIYKLYEEGGNDEEISKQLKVPVSRISKFRQSLGLEPNHWKRRLKRAALC